MITWIDKGEDITMTNVLIGKLIEVFDCYLQDKYFQLPNNYKRLINMTIMRSLQTQGIELCGFRYFIKDSILYFNKNNNLNIYILLSQLIADSYPSIIYPKSIHIYWILTLYTLRISKQFQASEQKIPSGCSNMEKILDC